MDKHTKDADKEDTFRDSLGQPNPAHEFQLKAIAEKAKQQEEREKELKKEEKAK